MEKTLTFTVEDALLSPIGFSILSGAGLFNGSENQKTVHVHKTATVTATSGDPSPILNLSGAINTNSRLDGNAEVKNQKETICSTAPIFVLPVETDGSIIGDMINEISVKGNTLTGSSIEAGTTYFVDFYVVREAADVTELQIDMKKFGGYFYVEASTLFRDQNTGVDMPAELTFPNVKIQSNFTFNMASTGDPSTFTFTMDAFPGYTAFDNTKKVLCCIQVVNDTDTSSEDVESVMGHDKKETELEFSSKDSVTDAETDYDVPASATL